MTPSVFMQEVAFLSQNAEKWKQFEGLLHADDKADPDRLAELFVEVTDDLSYAKTFFPESRTARYLNDLAAEIHQAIYQNKREDRHRFASFWRWEVPLTVRAAHREMTLALAIFVVAMGIGVVSTLSDDGFARLIMGDAYINMTLSNIEKGDPMAVYKQMGEVDMFMAITFNNVRVSFIAFAMGLLASFGTAYILLVNGIMLGTFHTFLFQQDYLFESLLVVYIHGTLEISAIIIAGGAGLVMGNSLLFPGTYTRGQAFMRAARRGVKIIVGLVPIFIAAGFLEGFVTRYTEMPRVLSLLIIGGSLGFILWYFVYYPMQIAKRSAAPPDDTTPFAEQAPAA